MNLSQVETLKTPRDSAVEMTEMVLPQHTNALMTVFGGVVMSWVDIAAATCAMRHCRKQVVTASVDAMHFLAPIKLGWVVSIQASVNYVWATSMEIGVKVSAENPLTGETYHTASAYLTFVALDSFGKPTKIAGLLPETEAEKKRHFAAAERRKARLSLKELLKSREQGKLHGN